LVAATAMLGLVAVGAHAAPDCGQLHDRYGDVADDRHIATAGGWDFNSMDIGGVALSSDRTTMTATVKVRELPEGGDQTHAYVWQVHFKVPGPPGPDPMQYLNFRTRLYPNAEEFMMQRWVTTKRTEAGGAFSEQGYGEDVAIKGSIDVGPGPGLIHMHVPLSLLRRWGVPTGTRLTDLYAFSTIITGAGTPAGNVLITQGGGPGDETPHRKVYAVGERGCVYRR
jgi:hypothetical protein